MPNRSSQRKLPRDVNQRAKSIVDQTMSEEAPKPHTTDDGMNPAAVALGRLGGRKGGKARAAKLRKAQLSEIAKKAARSRWNRRGLPGDSQQDERLILPAEPAIVRRAPLPARPPVSQWFAVVVGSTA
jgi:hypothetical protein